jgi:hypothetical protein
LPEFADRKRQKVTLDDWPGVVTANGMPESADRKRQKVTLVDLPDVVTGGHFRHVAIQSTMEK